jgi:RNA polymerase sigma-70 factor (ECF subfamily)
MQDVFMRVIQQPERFDASRSFSTWIYTIATNLCRNESRNAATRARLLEAEGKAGSAVGQQKDPLDEKRFRVELTEIFKELTDRDKTLFVLRLEHGLALKEIAQVHECPEGTVKSATYYLLKKIAARLPHYKPE